MRGDLLGAPIVREVTTRCDGCPREAVLSNEWAPLQSTDADGNAVDLAVLEHPTGWVLVPVRGSAIAAGKRGYICPSCRDS